MKEYKQIMFGDKINDRAIIRVEDNVCIPFDSGNTDFQEFIKLLENDFSILQTPDGKQADQGTIKAILKGKN